MNVTASVLKEIGAGDIPRIVAFNKIDLLPEGRELPLVPEKSFPISAKKDIGIDELTDAVCDIIYAGQHRVRLLIPYDQGRIFLLSAGKMQNLRYGIPQRGHLL